MKEYIQYQCEVCECVYRDKEWALICEASPVTRRVGVEVGDVVRIAFGECQGQRIQVDRVFVVRDEASQEWRHVECFDGHLLDRSGHTTLRLGEFERLQSA